MEISLAVLTPAQNVTEKHLVPPKTDFEKRYNYDRKWKFEVELKVIDFISTCLCLLLHGHWKVFENR